MGILGFFMDKSLVGKAQRFIDSAQKDTVLITDGYEYNYLKTLNKIDLYYNSKFLTGDRDSEGFKKLFMNTIKHRVNAATKAIDIDVKDIRVVANNGESYYLSWLFEQELHQFMREHGFAKLFNRLAEYGPRYGSTIVKDVNGEPQIVNLKNIIWDQSISDIKKSPFVVEKHVYSFDEFREMAKKNDWKNTDEVIEMYEERDVFDIQVIEMYAHCEKKYACENCAEDEMEEYTLCRSVIAGLEFYNDKNKKTDRVCKPVELACTEINELPYRIWHWEEEDGRNLGTGIVEDLFVNQEYHNEVSHLERKSLHWSSKKFFQTRDDTAPNNLFSEVNTGDVFNVKSEITPVPMEERNLPQYNLVFQRIDENANQRSFTYEVNTGEALPSGTPFRMGALLAQAVNSHYAYKRENFAIFIKEIITDFVMPQFKKKMKKGHTVAFSGSREQLDTIATMMIDAKMWAEVEKYHKKTGEYPSPEMYDAERAKLEESMAGKKTIHINLPDAAYDELETRLEIDITGESVNNADVTTLTTVFQIVSQNPAVLQDPQAKKVLDMILNKSGVNPASVFGVAKPQLPQAPQQQMAMAGPAGAPAPEAPSDMPDVTALMQGGQTPTQEGGQTL